MPKQDKLIEGIIAGTFGSLVKDLLSLIPEMLRLRPTYFDYGEYFVFRKINISTATVAIGIIVEILFGIFLAIIYHHLKHLIQTRHILLRGALFGTLIWFSLRGVVTIFQLNVLTTPTPLTVTFNVPIAAAYGFSVACVLRRLEQRGNL